RPEPVVKEVVDLVEVVEAVGGVEEVEGVDKVVVVSVVTGEDNESSVKELSLQPETRQLDVEAVAVEVIQETEADSEKVEETHIVQEIQKEPLQQEVMVEPLIQEEGIIELRPSVSLKKKVGVSNLIKKTTSSVYLDTEVQKVSSMNAHLTVGQLYAGRIAAGKVWESGARDSKYTIQLMALTSKNAEGNLKQMLAQEKYRQQASNFYIFKKNKTPAGILVFYGEYPTIAEARRMTKSIPAFLQKHKPYAISIKGAVVKVRK
ncbi:MAG: hypothetical protein KAI39_07150, partial [Desulfobulbaceae bacterium]|nr:hypothetical protein [Desulfobulbaceae bacterium]